MKRSLIRPSRSEQEWLFLSSLCRFNCDNVVQGRPDRLGRLPQDPQRAALQRPHLPPRRQRHPRHPKGKQTAESKQTITFFGANFKSLFAGADGRRGRLRVRGEPEGRPHQHHPSSGSTRWALWWVKKTLRNMPKKTFFKSKPVKVVPLMYRALPTCHFCCRETVIRGTSVSHSANVRTPRYHAQPSSRVTFISMNSDGTTWSGILKKSILGIYLKISMPSFVNIF